MVVHVVAAGRLSSAVLREACADYVQRFQRFGKLTVREVRAGPAHAPRAERMRKEGERLLAAAPPKARIVALTRAGQPETSEGFARRLAQWHAGAVDVAFLIGGAYGLAPDVLARSDATLSLSSLTLPHEIARLVLLEQLYRASTILQGTPYHKGH